MRAPVRILRTIDRGEGGVRMRGGVWERPSGGRRGEIRSTTVRRRRRRDLRVSRREPRSSRAAQTTSTIGGRVPVPLSSLRSDQRIVAIGEARRGVNAFKKKDEHPPLSSLHTRAFIITHDSWQTPVGCRCSPRRRRAPHGAFTCSIQEGRSRKQKLMDAPLSNAQTSTGRPAARWPRPTRSRGTNSGSCSATPTASSTT